MLKQKTNILFFQQSFNFESPEMLQYSEYLIESRYKTIVYLGDYGLIVRIEKAKRAYKKFGFVLKSLK